MRKLFRYCVSILFLVHGIYWGYRTIHILIGTISVFPDVIQSLMYDVDSSQQFRYGLSYFLQLVESLCIFCSSVMCVIIGLSKRKWRFILWSGILGVLSYLISCALGLIFLQSTDMGFYLHIVKFMLIYIPIIIFSFYYRKNESNAYTPISITHITNVVVKWVCSSFLKLKQLQQSKKIQWSEEKNTSHQDDNSGES